MTYWNEDRKEQVKKLWLEGNSASQIAAQMGATSRSAVIGIVRRMKLSRSHDARAAAIKVAVRRASQAPRATPIAKKDANPLGGKIGKMMREAKASAPPVEVVLPVRATAWNALPGVAPILRAKAEPKHCKWPITVEGNELSHCCGAVATAGPYCASHDRMARPASAAEKARALDASHARMIFGRRAA